MKPIAYLLGLSVSLVFLGCETTSLTLPTKPEQEIRTMNLEGLKIGDTTTALTRFAQVQRVPFGRTDYAVYDIYNPNSQISLAKAYFAGDRLKRLEFRYFDGPNIRTLSRAGGWAGLKDYLISRFGPPSREGPDVRVVTDVPGLKPQYAKFNGEWIFSRQNRQLNYIVLSDPSGGIGVVTLQDTTPAPTPTPVPVIIRRQVSAPPPVAKPSATPAILLNTPPPPPDPGF